ncbi:MAG: hypothetical protein AAGU27_01470 [Dehalobacterium sp.]
MNNNLIMAKLKLPYLGRGIIKRNRLMAKMEDFKKKKLTYVIAPAGYGKTVFIKQFIDSMELPFVWYQLDNFDNDPIQFFQYFIKGLSTACPDIKINLPEFNPEEQKPEKKYYHIMAAIINKLEEKVDQGLIIVFDDFHLINEVKILKFMEHFLSYLPNMVHMVISSRYQPDLKLYRLKAGENVIEINQQDLAFTPPETITLLDLKNTVCLDQGSIKAVLNKLSGWALGLHLFKLAWKGSVTDSVEAASLKADNEIFAYISMELFAGLPLEIQEFMLMTAVLENMTPDICNYLIKSNDADRKLKYIERKNLFIMASGRGEEISYRYHHVFRDFLLSLLTDGRREALVRAGEYYLKCGAFEQAVEYFRLANDDQMLVQSVEQAGQQMLRQGKLKTVAGWLTLLSERGLLKSPVLVMLKGELLSYGGSFAEAEVWIDQAFTLFKEDSDQDGMVRTVIHKARILRYRASFAESTKFINGFLKDQGQSLGEYFLEIAVEKVYSQWLMGDIPGAIETAQQALHQKDNRKNKKVAERLFRYMAVLYFLRGNYSAALELYKEILDACGGCADGLEQGSIPLYMSCIHRERGDLPLALDMLKQSVARKQRVGFTEDLHLVYFNMAVTLLSSGDQHQIDYYCRMAEDAFQKTGGQLSYYEGLLKAFRSLCAAYLGGEASAEAELLMKESASSLKNKSGYLFAYISPYYVIYYLKYKQFAKAYELLQQVIPASEAMGIKFQTSMLQALMASLLITDGDREGALLYTKQSLKLAAAEGYERFFRTFPELLPCLKVALVNGVELIFVEKIIINLGFPAVPFLMELIKHSDAQVRGRSVRLLKTGSLKLTQQEIEQFFFHPDEGVSETGFALHQELVSREEQTRTKLFICCLGNFKVYLHSNWKDPVIWRTSKAKELFAYLLHWKGQPVSSERILADLWPDINVEKARDLFHTNLTHVKSLLKLCGLKDNLKKTQTGYVLNTQGIACDVWLPDQGGLKGVYLDDIYSDWPYDKRTELERKFAKQ